MPAPTGDPRKPSFAVLRSHDEIDAARRLLVGRGLSGAESWGLKTWDVELALDAIDATVDRGDAVLDMGSVGCAILPSLHQLGYQRLHGVDLNPQVLDMPFHDVIHYSTQDMNATTFDDHSFSAITSISVIEHGLHADVFWREVARLLRPGGVFLFSTDYWPDKIDTSGTALFDLPWTIFSAEEIGTLMGAAADHGLVPAGDLEPLLLQVDEPSVHYADRDYTFLFGALTRAA